MDKLCFGDFVWPNNPEEYREEYVREACYDKDVTGKTVFSGMGPVKRVITGSGAFFGANACTDFSKLAARFDQSGTEILTHPVFGARTVYFTGLKMTQRPKADYVAYTFEFTQADADGAIPK